MESNLLKHIKKKMLIKKKKTVMHGNHFVKINFNEIYNKMTSTDFIKTL